MAADETWAVIPSRSRPEQLGNLITTLTTENISDIVVVDNGYEGEQWWRDLVHVVHCDEQPPNLSRMWNMGLDRIAHERRYLSNAVYNVAFFNDDTVLPSGWLAAVVDALRTYNVVAASSDPSGRLREPIVKRLPDRNPVMRMCPWAFIIRAEFGLRADEELRWWWGDTDMDFQARVAGGVVIIPGYTTKNTLANTTTVGELAKQAGRDGKAFARKWGFRPW